MIVAYPQDLAKFREFPVTLAILAVNILIYFLIFDGPGIDHTKPDILKSENLIFTAQLYLQSIPDFKKEYQNEIPQWILQINRSHTDQMELLGIYSLRDQYFLNFVGENYFFGDQVAISKWLEQVHEFRNSIERQPVYFFGLNMNNRYSWSWMTYQFSHSGLLHLFSNMVFLLLLGFGVESIAGGFGLILIYILGGVAGGLLFLTYNAHGSLPMVGASASVSSLLAFYCLAEQKWRVRYFYFLSPMADHYGIIYLSPLLIIPLYLLVDFTSVLASPEGLNVGVAYSAHVGGAMFGFFAAIAFRFWNIFKNK